VENPSKHCHFRNAVEQLDLEIFKYIPSQTSRFDKKSLLAIQRAFGRVYETYIYLEIGSHLGGSIQPHLVDSRCKRIYSIDLRPATQADDRNSGILLVNEGNSTERMLKGLSAIGAGDLSKIECIGQDAADIDSEKIVEAPQIAFIDGEHTNKAALSDYKFCRKVIADNGVIVFHDYAIVYPAIQKICKDLQHSDVNHFALKMEGNVFAIFFDEAILSDPYLARVRRYNFLLKASFYLERALLRLSPRTKKKLVPKLRKLTRSMLSVLP